MNFRNAILLIFFTPLLLKSFAQITTAVLNKKIVIRAAEIEIDALLTQFSKQSSVEFSFNSRQISSSLKVKVLKQEQSLQKWLTDLTKMINVEYQFLGNHIILHDREARFASPTTSKSNQEKLAVTSEVNKFNNSKINAVNDTVQHMPSQTLIKKISSEQTRFTQPSSALLVNWTIDSTFSRRRSLLELYQANSYRKVTKQSDIVNKNAVPNKDGESFQVCIGQSVQDGNGVYKGIFFSTEYTRFTSKRFAWNYAIRGTINGQNSPVGYLAVNSDTIIKDYSYHTVAGVQIGVHAQYSLLKTGRIELYMSLGPFARYQSASVEYLTFLDRSTGVEFSLGKAADPRKTLSFGGIMQSCLNHTFRNGTYAGIVNGVQIDTNGDLILHLGVSIGKHF